MVVVEVVAAVLVLGLIVAATYAGLVGVLGVIGVVRFVRCDKCGRFGLTSPSEPLRACGRCRHGALLHPLYGRHHAKA